MNEKVNYEGVKFGMLTVIKDGNGLYEGAKKRRSVICKCDCGNEKEILLRQIQRGKQKSCGCLATPKIEFKEGDKFGYWTVIKPDSENYVSPVGHKSTTCEVECMCGKVKTINKTTLKNGKTNSCGCQIKYFTGKRINEDSKIKPLNLEEMNKRDLGHWIVVEEVSAKRDEEAKIIRTIKMRCKCGYEKICNIKNANDSKQCSSCANEEIRNRVSIEERGLNNSIESRYRAILKRCYDTRDKAYRSYGAKGIDVYEEWLNNFSSFKEWCKNNGLTTINYKDLEIDRKDSTKGYHPENCWFVTKYENILRSLNLSMKDLHFIRSDKFDWNLHRKNYKCSDYVIKNIIEYKSFNIERLLIL